MRVLVDFHHDCLYESLILLCDRLGWTLYRPVGMEWYEQEYWNHERKWHGDAIARQYLPTDGSNPFHGRTHNLLSLEQARDEPPDIVLSSLAHNHEGFARFASEVGATFGLQVGNVRFSAQDMAEDRWDLAAFGLVSGLMPVVPPKPHVVYHQEFDLRTFVRPPRLGLTVSSFVQCYPQDTPAYAYWTRTAEIAPEHNWRVYGAYGEAPSDVYEAGNLPKCTLVREEMEASDVAWHAKRWSDGYGHVIHQWFATGRPLLGFHDYYKDQLAGRLWVEGETAWDIGSRTPSEVADLLRRFRDDESFHIAASEAAVRRFNDVVDFDDEEHQIRDMFSRVLP